MGVTTNVGRGSWIKVTALDKLLDNEVQGLRVLYFKFNRQFSFKQRWHPTFQFYSMTNVMLC